MNKAPPLQVSTPILSMKSSLFAAACALALCLAGCADKKPHRPDPSGNGGGIGMGNPQQNAEQMASDLGLSEEQKKSFMAAMKEHGQKMRALRSNNSLSQDQRTKQADAARQQLAKRMHSILTQEQFTKWQQERQAMHANGQGGPGGQGGPPGPGGPGGAGGPPPGPNGGYPPNGAQPNRYLLDSSGSPPPAPGRQIGGNEPAPSLPPLPPVNPN
jgi:hypothetical protein